MKRSLTPSIIILFTMLFLFSCAGSHNDSEDFLSDDEKQEKELDDIEALLGISPSESSLNNQEFEPEVNKETPSEQLDMLSTSTMINTSQPDPVSVDEKRDFERKIANLEQQVKEKNRAIADLSATITEQRDQIDSSPIRSIGGSTTIVSTISMDEYQSRYDDARDQFENANYSAAIPLFESLLAASTKHSLADNAQFWIGECHYALREYDAAIIDFEKVFTFTKSNKQDASQFKLGLCYIRKGDKTKAGEEFNRLIRNYPKSVFASKAENRLANL